MSTRTPLPRRSFHPLTLTAASRSCAAFAALAILVSSCSRDARTPVAPAPDSVVATPVVTSNTVTPTLYASGVSPVTTWNPIFPAVADPTWEATSCTTVPAVSLNASWQNPHSAFVDPRNTNGSQHPWVGSLFTAAWINAWNSLPSQGPMGPNGPQSWTKYTTPVSGVGAYVLQLLADNCSWVYINDQLVGVQPTGWNASNTKYSVTLAGDATLSFIIFDGGGLAGGKFRLETYGSYIANGGDPSLVSAPPTLTATTTTVSFGAGPFPYTGTAYTATATVSTGATATIVYAGDCVNAGNTCTATAAYAGDATHAGSSATANITIDKAPSTTAVTFGPGPFPYTGTAYTATATVSPSGSASIVYGGDCILGGTSCTATATYLGDPNHTGSQAMAQITITYTVCAARDDDDHEEDGKDSRGIEAGRTLPVKLRVCDAQGRNISAKWLQVRAVGVSPSGSLNDSGRANPGNLFRLDDHTYMYNLSTKGFTAGAFTLDYTIGADPTVYHYAFTVRASKKDGKGDKDDKGDKKP